MRYFYRFFLILLFSLLASRNAISGASEFYNLALQGDLSSARAALEAEPDEEIQKRLIADFDARFVEKAGGLDLKMIKDPLTRGAAGIYQDYWRRTLLDPASRSEHEDQLAAALIALMIGQGHESSTLGKGNIQDKLRKAIEENGYHVILGRTPPLLEFMVWGNIDSRSYEVDLTDRVQNVSVHFLTDFVSRGWAHFATFGRSSTGGWATDEGLYAVRDGYDLDSEKFLVSYLKHEARHFADYGLYPNLESADLEYRAKLTEIAFASETLQSLLKGFQRHAARVADAPHSLANWHLIRNLARILLEDDPPADPGAWSEVSGDRLQAAAIRLLEENDRALAEGGAGRTKGVILP